MSDELERYRRQCMSTFSYLRQGEIWIPRRPRPPIRIAEMDKPWRFNAVRFMERRAASLAVQCQFGEIYWMGQPVGREVAGETDGKPVFRGPVLTHFDLMSDSAMDAMDEYADHMMRDPLGWLRETTLIRALAKDLPKRKSKLEKLAARASHWSACPGRVDPTADCRCREIKAAFDAAEAAQAYSEQLGGVGVTQGG